MKKLTVLVLTALLLLGMAACGAKAPAQKDVDLDALYKGFEAMLPNMFLPEGDMRLNYMGIEEADCAKVITAVAEDGLAADEVWLIQAKDADALERLTALANNRLAVKADETIDYNPEQYKIVEKGVVVTCGNYLALLVSPQVDAMKAAFEAAAK